MRVAGTVGAEVIILSGCFELLVLGNFLSPWRGLGINQALKCSMIQYSAEVILREGLVDVCWDRGNSFVLRLNQFQR